MMRIAHVNQDRGTAPSREKGAAVHVRAMRRAFEALGATVVAIDEPEPRAVRDRLRRELGRGGLDLVYERYSIHAYAAGEVARGAGIPHVLEVNAPLTEEAARYRPETLQPVSAERERELFRGARIVAVSRATAEFALARGARREHVSILPNAVDPEVFQPLADERERDARVPRGRFVLGVHGRFRPWHNLAMAVRATRRLLEGGAPALLMVVGYGDGVEALAELPPEARLHLPWCSHEEVAGLVACFDALPLTYAGGDGFYFSPLKLLEGMACGAVPVVPRLGDLPEQVVAYASRAAPMSPLPPRGRVLEQHLRALGYTDGAADGADDGAAEGAAGEAGGGTGDGATGSGPPRDAGLRSPEPGSASGR